MLLSANLHPFAAPVCDGCVQSRAERRGALSQSCCGAALICVNFACNSCLIADRTIAIRRRSAAVMRTKSGRAAGRARSAQNCLHSFFPTVRPVRSHMHGESSCFVVVVESVAWLLACAVHFPTVPSTTS